MTASLHTTRYRFLRELLTETRKSQGLSQEALAERLGRLQTFVSKYERGERRLDVVELLDVTEALQLDASKLIRQLMAMDGS
ncbi:MAG: helix-turn-helix transcriptional regulator [Planctomycetaceae bacterium]|nr:helix-turn-helix transcriptional regulator [Planctomycetales bacterium]MCB9937132.1 helix-turn-helix transcriptional regulator [Planctomycetaceae bacterium]